MRGAALALAVSAGLAALASSVAVRVWLTNALVLLRAAVPALAGGIVGAVLLGLTSTAGLSMQLIILGAAGLVMAVTALLVPLSHEAAGRSSWKAIAAARD